MIVISKYLVNLMPRFFLLVAVMLPVSAVALVDTGLVVPAIEMDTTGCLSCHGDSQKEIQVLTEEGVKHLLPVIAGERFISSAHGGMTCMSCHSEITDSQTQHQKSGLAKPDCATCHEALWETIEQKGSAPDNTRMATVVQNIESYRKSIHAIQDKSGILADCEDCHDTHYFNIPHGDAEERTEWHRTIPDVCGTACHEDQLKEYRTSIHASGVTGKHNVAPAVCTDCHTAHAITQTTRDPFQLSVIGRCGSCHLENLKTYRGTYHGQISALGYAHTAKCYNCHGSHTILDIDDPASTIHPDNRLETCRTCHDGKRILLATQNFLSFSPHASADDYQRYPEVWITARFMYGLILFVFSFFWLHSLLWWYREYRDRKAGKIQLRIRTSVLPQEESKQVRRFGLTWRIAHLLFALSVMLLILTGMAVFYSYTAWAPIIIDVFGGPQRAGLVHRISAAFLLGIFLLHLVAVSINIYRSRNNFRWFGPDSLLPCWKDFSDAFAMLKWFVNGGARPEFDRWTYWEKFDYWAVFWGMAVIGGSGLMLALPNVTASMFPGWVFNVVMLVHGEEAFMTAVFLFTVHFFNNHFRPDKLPPPDVVMFTGTQSVEEFKRDHRLQYERLVETGQLEKYLVDVPSRPMTVASKILGLVLITCGLALLAIVATGFFGGYASA